MVGENHAADAYDAMAPVYDEFNSGNNYELWLGEVLLPELEKHGLRVGQALDVGCGTGRAFAPLQERGWTVVGCDVSEGMLRRALDNTLLPVVLQCADARELPDFGGKPFDLILALNDVVNYLTEDGDLEKCFAGMKRNLAPGGLVCFDANCLSLFEANWIAGKEAPIKERGWEWTGLTEQAVAGGVFEAEVGGEGMETHLHRERHWPSKDLEVAMGAAGLEVLAVLGLREDPAAHRIYLDPEPNEHSHPKVIYIGGHDG